MKNRILALLVVAAAVSGCRSPYDYMENWLVREDAVRAFSVPVDVIYVQDQLYVDLTALPKMQSIVLDAVGRGKLDGFARVFSPLIANEDDVENAVKWYVKHHNKTCRPFALIGEGRGGALLKAYAEDNVDWLEGKGMVASFFSDVPDEEFVSKEMIHTIKNRAAEVRYRRQWGRDMPDGMLGE